MQDVTVVRVPRRVLFEAVVTTMDLTIHCTGCDAAATGLVTAWLRMDLPRRSGEPRPQCRMFHGDPCLTQSDAEESVAREALEYLCKYHNIAVDDYNYSASCVAASKALSSQQLVQDREGELDLAIQETAVAQKEHMNRMNALARICYRFSDILPFQGSLSRRRSAVSSVSYSGLKPPQTRVEQLASDIYHFFTGTNLAGGRTTWL